MSSVAVCTGTVGDTTVVVDSVTVHTATCTVAWAPAGVPSGDLDPMEFGAYFTAVFVLTLIFYFTVVMPSGYVLRAVKKAFPKA